MENQIFKSVLAPYMASLLEFKKIRNQRTERYLYTLKSFDNYCLTGGISDIADLSVDFIQRWREKMIDNKEITIYAKYQIINQLLCHMRDLGVDCPRIRLPRSGSDSYVPYIFSLEQIIQIFKEADNLRLARNDVRWNMYYIPSAIRLLYCTGIRCGELTALRNVDVDLVNGTMVLQHTKNGQQRLIPLSESVVAIMQQFKTERVKLNIADSEKDDSPFFINALGKAATVKNIYEWFQRILRRCGIPHKGRRYGPRVHDLRHTFAVHSLMRHIKNGKAVETAMPWLATYLGHKRPQATEHYVRLASDATPMVCRMQSEIGNKIYENICINNEESTDW